jgi:iron(III) transport system substrate-binding protein
MMRFSRFNAALFGTALAALTGAAAAQAPQTFETRFADLIAKAKAEGELTWYQSLLEASGKEFSAHFQQRFGIKVAHQFMSSGSLWERFRAETASGRHLADVYSSGDTSATREAIKAGYIARYEAATKGEFPQGWVIDDPNGTAYPTQRVQIAVVYNTQLVKPEDAKVLSTWKGLTDPRFGDGALGLNDPTRALSAVPPYYYWTRVAKAEYGSEFLEKLAAQKPVIFPGQTEQAARLGAGEYSAGMMVDIVAIQQYDLGAPIGWHYPAPTPIVIQYSAISKNATHPNAARLFLEYISSEEGLSHYKRASGGSTGRPDLDAKQQPKYAQEPWYRAPTELFVIQDWDAALKEYRPIIAEWAALFLKK